MPKPPASTYACSECGHTVTKWVGRCPGCQAFSTMEEQKPAASSAGLATKVAATSTSRAAQRIKDVQTGRYERISTGIGEFDRVLGGGLVPGGVVLVGGAPGIGKSTLLLSTADLVAQSGHTVLIVSGEESVEQIKMRADRTGALADDLFLAAESSLGAVLSHIEEVQPTLLIVDSIQTLAADDLPGRMGSVSQVTEVTSVIVRVAKERGIATLLVGHVTKDDAIAGPRLIEHLVDASVLATGDKMTSMRFVRAIKNRFGPADEVGVFVMENRGIVEVSDPSGLFLAEHGEPTPGAAVTVVVEGRRAFPVEVQALTVPTQSPNPRRSSSGLDNSRLAMLLAVLEKHGKVRLSTRDVFASTIGGIKVIDPSTDLALVLALASAENEMPLRGGLFILGEVALSGDVRPVSEMEKRLNEGLRRGFKWAIVPPGTQERFSVPSGLTVVEVETVGRALRAFAEMTGRPASHDA